MSLSPGSTSAAPDASVPEQPASCAHCGLPSPAAPDGAPSFCCRGCRTVWELVHQAGLDDYYQLRARLEDGESPGRGRAEQADREPAYAHLDDPAVLDAVAIDAAPGTAELRCTGLHCAACVWLIERLPRQLPGLSEARVDFGRGRVQLRWDPARVRLSDIAALLHRAGYELHAVDARAQEAERVLRRRELVRLAIAGASAGNVMLVSFALYAGALSSMDAQWTRFFEWTALILAIPAVVYGGAPFYQAALAGLRARSLHIDLPIALGVLGGFVASVIATVRQTGEVYFDSVSLLVFLLLIGRHVQRRGQQWALSQTDLLQLLVPARARRLLDDGRRQDCSSGALAVGERVEVLVGEGIPADGTLVSGRASIDARSLTGESRPLTVERGDLLLAGTVVVDGSLELEVTAVGADTRIGSLAARISAADRARAPIERAVDRISGLFVAGVLTLALIGGLAWWFIDPSRVFAVVVALLVISCPCALGLATPVALAVGRARAAGRGMLMASAGALEALARVETVVFDKTGTLTEGVLDVRTLVTDGVDGVDEAALAAWLAAIEADSGHPVGQALRRWAQDRAAGEVVEMVEITELEDLPGRGRRALSKIGPTTHELRVGSLGWVTSLTGARLKAGLDAALARGDTPVAVELDGRVVALLALADRVRPDAAQALARLRALGLKLAIRSGDHPQVVAAVARELGIDDARGGQSPDDKAEDLAMLGPRTAMIGDGVNDAPAMRAAGVGVAVRGGAEIALRTADVHLAEPGLSTVVELFERARATMTVIRRNLAFSLAYNLCFAGLALAGLISPLAAAVLMPASSLTVLLSSVLARPLPRRGASTPARALTLQTLHPRTTVLRGQSL